VIHYCTELKNLKLSPCIFCSEKHRIVVISVSFETEINVSTHIFSSCGFVPSSPKSYTSQESSPRGFLRCPSDTVTAKKSDRDVVHFESSTSQVG
jgi:hypothetical protein